ncbi:MAG: cytochrome c biogenesis CcdA family protein [Clostridia bacterium]|jgi:cytochrome c biogenesis protein CcdA
MLVGASLLFFWPVLDAASQEETIAKLFPVVRAEYYGEIGCSHCDTFAEKQLPAAELASGIDVELELYDILSTEGFSRCEERLAELGEDFKVFPVLILGDNVFQGNTAIEENLLTELEYFAEHGYFNKRQPQSLRPGTGGAGTREAVSRISMTWAFIPIFMAGLVDGVNPCAFTTLLFFMSYLSLRGGNRKRMAIAGLMFAAGVFFAYFMLGLGLVNTLRMGNTLSWLRLALKLVVTALTVWFCLLSIRDVYHLGKNYREGQSTDLALKLPEALRLRIDASIRQGMRSKVFYPGLFGTGVVVAILELACTGQVYFPAISFMVQSDASWLGIGSLILYNLAFITPLLAILVLVLFGMRQEALRNIFMRHIAITKLALAAVYALLAVSVWLI